MKSILVIVSLVFVCKTTHGQELIFKMSQTGISYKDENTNKYNDAEIKSTDIIITLQDKQVKVMGEELSTFSLEKIKGQNSNTKNIYTRKWKGTDDNKNPVDFKYTVNVESKEAMIEVAYKDFRNYYFGKFSYGNVRDAENKSGIPASFSKR